MISPLFCQFFVYLLSELGLLIGGGLRHRGLTSTDDERCQQERRDPNSCLQALQPQHGEYSFASVAFKRALHSRADDTRWHHPTGLKP